MTVAGPSPSPSVVEMAAHQLAALRDGAGQGEAETVEDGLLAERDHVVGQVRGLRFVDERGDVARQLLARAVRFRPHAVSPIVDDVG